MPNQSGNELQGVGILVTRPAAQADSLLERIEARGGRGIRMPVLEITDVAEPSRLAALYDRLPEFDIAIFVSANSVHKAVELVLVGRPWPDSIKVAAVGPSTQQALAGHGIDVQICPQHQFDSEGLLALRELHDEQARRIFIFRGEGGRSLLADTLRERGAQVEYAELYRRAIPSTDVKPVFEQFEAGDIDIITVSSLESLRNLEQMLGSTGRPWLCNTPIVVINQKMVAFIEKIGGEENGGEKNALLAENATDEAIVDAILRWKNTR